MAVLQEAETSGVLSDEMADLLSGLPIEYLITPNTGETAESASNRLSAAQPADTIEAALR